jgi:RNA polymerase sigma factor (sigma-70 family)
MDEAEDIASDTFLTAMQSWPFQGLPQNPTAWLYAVAKHKAANRVVRQTTFQAKVVHNLGNDSPTTDELTINLSDENIDDSQLRMIFTVCHPVLSQEAQVALALRVLCGFGIDEIATAFLTTKDTINKRLFRAKEKLRADGIDLEFPAPAALDKRLNAVLVTLYLLFSEGYYSENHESVIREDFCFEAMRLTHLLVNSPKTNLPVVNALLALMCFQASRLKARKSSAGNIILYDDQDESAWDRELIATGAKYLHASAMGPNLTKYHLEASIAYWHTQKEDALEKWQKILDLYNHLLALEYSPVAALNRTYALSKVYGAAKAIHEAEKLQLTNSHFYFTLLGELYTGLDRIKAEENLQKALRLARTNSDREIILRKIERLR